MSRNLTVQLAIAGLLLMVLAFSSVQMCQYNSIEKTLLEVRQKTEHNSEVLAELKDRVEKGVAVAGPGVGAQNPGQGGAAPSVEGNILSADATPLRAPGAQEGGELKLFSGDDFKGFNVLIENSVDVQEIYTLFIGGQLARRHFSDPDKWHGDLAEAIKIEENNTVYHVWLKKGVKWHKPAVDFSNPRYKWLDKDHFVTADDLKFTMEMVQSPKVAGAASLRSYFEDFDRIEVINEHELKYIWKKPVFKSKASTLELPVVPRWLYGFNEDGEAYSEEIVADKFNEHWYNDRGIGMGPYKFVENKSGEYLKLTRNDDYYGGRAAIKDVTFKIVKEPEARLIMFKKGELDVLALTPTQYNTEILADPNSPFNQGKFKYVRRPRLAYRYLGWNEKSPLFEDKRVRQAMTMAFNREKIVKEVFFGLGQVVTGSFYPNSAWYSKDTQPWPFDLDRSAKLLEEAGWTDSDKDGIRDRQVNGQKKNFEFQLLVYNSSPEFKAMADILKEDLIKIGVRMTVSPVDWPQMQKQMEDKEFEAFTGGWGLDWEADLRQIWHSSQADAPKGSNFISFKNAEVDKISDALDTEFDFGKRKELCHRFNDILHEEQPYTFFMAPETVLAYQPWVQNLTFQEPRPQTLYHLVWLEPRKP